MTARGSVLLPEFLPTLIKPKEISDSRTTVHDYAAQIFVCQRLEAGSNDLYSETIMATDRQMLRQVPAHTEDNQLNAAAILEISLVTLRGKLRTLGIDPSDIATS